MEDNDTGYYTGRWSSKPSPVGYMPLPAGNKKLFGVQGGPFESFGGDDFDPDTFAICLEAKSPNRDLANVVLEVPDFSTPNPEELDDALAKMVDALYAGRPAFIGCRAGQGRTGLAMACLARAFGLKRAVWHVRRYYSPRAVETAEQELFVYGVDLPKTAKRLRINRIKAFLGMK